MKRLFDIAFSLVILAVFLPFGLLIALVLRLTGEGKVFYLQPRIGRDGRIFRLIKFATMLENSPNIGTGDITLQDDPRVLPAGKFLRKTKINEVPQIFNILKGEMSVVGPRPLTEKNFRLYPDDVQKEIVKMPPGLTGVGSIVFRDEESIIAKSTKPYLECYRDEISPYKGALELWYLTNHNLRLDLKIILLTVWIVIFPHSVLYERVLLNLPSK